VLAMTLSDSKVQRRAEARAVLQAIPKNSRAAQASQVVDGVRATTEWRKCRQPLLFIPLHDEIDVSPLISVGLSEGKRVCLPAFDSATGVYFVREVCDLKKDLVPGKFQISEPGAHCQRVPVGELDFLLVPGLAFDPSGGRLGRGKGFYDRLLVLASGTIWGVGFIEQVVSTLPCEAHDQKLHGVFTAVGLQTGSRSK